jgi:hypothetical protein
MTTLSWTQVQNWITQNPHDEKDLPPFLNYKQNINLENDILDDFNLTKNKVSPSTPLSAILLGQDTLYGAYNESSRRAVLRSETTDLQEKAIIHLKGRSWPVRRTAEGISACGLEEGRASSWPSIGWKALCELRECQVVIVNEEKKEIQFFPEDIRTWRSDIDIFFVEYECRFLWTHKNMCEVLNSWLEEKEKQSWSITWPLAEGSMEELKKEYSNSSDSFSGKLIKENIQKRLGRLQSFKLVSSWSFVKN